MRERWLGLVARLADGSRLGPANAVFDDLLHRYNADHRQYHNISHINACLTLFDTIRPLAQRPDALELAIWFHDAIYDSHRSDNEEASARLAAGALTELGVRGEIVRDVAELVRATRHSAVPSDPDAALLVDIDLAILGQATDIFDAYEAAIRAEYAWVTDVAFRRGRAKVLQSFLDRPWVYATEHFRKAFESAARENLKRSLTKLSD